MSAVPIRRAFPNSVKMSGPRGSFSGAVVNDVPSDCDRCVLLHNVSAFSISSGLCIVCHCSEGSDGGVMFQGMEVSSGIPMNLIPLDCFCLVWYLRDRCIYC